MDRIGPAVPVGEDEIQVPVRVEIRRRDIDRGVVPRPERRPFVKASGAVAPEDEVLPTPIDDEDVRVRVAVQVRQGETPGRTRSAEGAAPLEASGPIVQEHEVAGAIVPGRDVEVPVPVEVGEGGRVRAVLLVPQPAGQREPRASVVQKDPVLLGPVPAVGHDEVERTVAVHITQTDRGREPAFGAKGAERPERPLLLAADAARGEREGREGA